MSANPAINDSDFEGERLDYNVINTIYDLMGSDKYQELVGMYKDNSANHMAQINQIMQAKDFKELKTPVHSMKGSSGNVGAMYLSHICLQIEGLIFEASVDEGLLEKFVSDLATELAYALEELGKK